MAEDGPRQRDDDSSWSEYKVRPSGRLAGWLAGRFFDNIKGMENAFDLGRSRQVTCANPILTPEVEVV